MRRPGDQLLGRRINNAVLGSLASGATAQLALIGTGVIAARVLGPTDRGYHGLLTLVPAIVLGVGTLGVPRAVTYYLASDPLSERSVRAGLRTLATGQVLVLTLVHAGVLGLILSDDPRRTHVAAIFTAPLVLGFLAEAYGKAILQGQERYLAFNVMRNASLFSYLAGLVILSAIGIGGLVPFAAVYAAAYVVGGAATLGVSLAPQKSPQSPQPTIVPRKSLLAFGLRGYVASLSPTSTFRLDQMVVGLLLSPRALGIYIVGLSFTNLPAFLARSIGFVAFPHVAATRKEDSVDSSTFVRITIGLSGAVVIVLAVAVEWLLPLFFGSEFEDAVVITQILLVGSFAGATRQILTETSAGRGRPALGSWAEASSWLVLVPAVAVLLPSGAPGVALATSIAAVSSLVVILVLLRYGPERSDQLQAPDRDDQ